MWFDRFRRRTEKRDAGFFPLTSPSFAAVYSGSSDVEAVPASASCISLISSLIGSLPVQVLRDGSPAPPSTPALRITRRPCPTQSWAFCIGSGVRDLLRHGNALWMIGRDDRGAARDLVYVPWSWVAARVVDGGDGPELAFDVMSKSVEAELLQLPPRILSSDAMHCRMMSSDDGVLGRSPLQRCTGPLREGAELSKLGLSTWTRGLRPSGVLTSPNFLNDTQRERYGEAWMEKFTGSINAGRVPLIEGGWELRTVAMSSTDAQYVENRSFNTRQICNLLNVPSVLLESDQHAITDMSSYMTTLAQCALSPIISILEQEFNHAVLGDGDLELRIDLSGLQRGSFQSTVSALTALQMSGSLSANEVRDQLDWPPSSSAGADDLRPNGSPPSWASDKPGLPAMHPSPGPTGDSVPNVNTHQNQGRKGNGAEVPQ